MFRVLRKLAAQLNPRGPNKFEPQTKAPQPQYPTPEGQTEYGDYQNPHKGK